MANFAVTVAIFLFFLPSSVNAALAGRNLILNGSFENPKGWSAWNSEYNGLLPNEFRKGSQSVYLSCPKENDATGIFFAYTNAKPGKAYTFSCYVKNSPDDPIRGNAFGQLSIEWRKKDKDKDGKDISIEISRDWGPKFGPELSNIRWVPVTMTATAPPDTDSCNFTVQLFNKGGGNGRLFVDDVEAEEMGGSAKVGKFMLSGTRPNQPPPPSTVSSRQPAETPVTATLLTADFNSGSKPNNLGGDFGCWNKDPNDKSQGCNMRFNSSIKNGDDGFSLQLDYDVDSPNQAFDGFWMKLQNQNISRYDRMVFWVKGDETAGFSRSLKLELKNAKGEVGRYTLSSKITKDWQKITIPVKQFEGLTDLSSMTEFVIVFEDKNNTDKKAGTIYIDDVQFVK